MPSNSKDFEALRSENQQLGARITRICVILIAMLTIVVLTLANALDQVDLSKLQQELNGAKVVTAAYWNAYYDKAYGSNTEPITLESEEDKEEFFANVGYGRSQAAIL
jgi:hypothetical protein